MPSTHPPAWRSAIALAVALMPSVYAPLPALPRADTQHWSARDSTGQAIQADGLCACDPEAVLLPSLALIVSRDLARAPYLCQKSAGRSSGGGGMLSCTETRALSHAPGRGICSSRRRSSAAASSSSRSRCHRVAAKSCAAFSEKFRRSSPCSDAVVRVACSIPCERTRSACCVLSCCAFCAVRSCAEKYPRRGESCGCRAAPCGMCGVGNAIRNCKPRSRAADGARPAAALPKEQRGRSDTGCGVD